MFTDRVRVDMEKLKKICEKEDSICYQCRFCSPNAGYDVPYCTKLGTNQKPYKLKAGTVVHRCKMFYSAEAHFKQERKKDITRRIKKLQRRMEKIK